MRKTRFIANGRCYHLFSRLAHQAFFLDDDEKTRAVELLRRVEEFSGVIVFAYAIMSNHFHIFIYVPEAEELGRGDPAVAERILELLADGPMRPSALRQAVGIRNSTHFNRYYLTTMIAKGLVERTDPAHPRSPQQKYRLA